MRSDLFVRARLQLLSVANLIDTNATRGNDRSKVDSMLWKSAPIISEGANVREWLAVHPNSDQD